MAILRISSLQVKGFNIPEWSSQILFHMHKLRSHILCLHETDLLNSHIPSFCNKYYPVWCHNSNHREKTKGVAIFLKSLPCQILEVKKDEDARAVFVKCSMQGSTYNIANIYALNQGQLSFLLKTLNNLTSFAQALTVLCGDFNFISLNRIMTLFIWPQRRPRIDHTTLTRLKLEGGLAIPDFKSYFLGSDGTNQNI